MANFDVFNGDADGLCALHQLRLAEPRDSVLITGVKRDIDLLRKVHASAGDHITVLDVSLDKNRGALQKLLEQGSQVTYVDHHFAGDIPDHPALNAIIDPSPGVCTSSLVDELLQGHFRIWAVVAAFGDNSPGCATRLAASLGLSGDDLDKLSELGACLNYNAYGNTVDDLFFHPAELYRHLHAYPDPFDFMTAEAVFPVLKRGYTADMAMAKAEQPAWVYAGGAVYILPDQSWSRRVSGAFGNYLAQAEPALAHAVLTRKPAGGYGVSVRAPRARPTGADELCYRFETGGGRKSAAGINELPENDLSRFLDRFGAAFDISHR
ncbi:MAG TPA: DHH family phosphoesterase [Nitrosospira sp.]